MQNGMMAGYMEQIHYLAAYCETEDIALYAFKQIPFSV